MAKSKLVSQATQTFGKPSSCDSSEGQLTQNASHSEVTPVTKETDVVSMSFMRRLYQNKGFSPQATNIILSCWRESSHQQYGTYISKWLLFCSEREINPVRPSITMAVEFLTELYDLGLGYSSINTARCALSAILEYPSSSNSTFGQSVDVKRFMKGIFQSRPALPRYNKTWDVQTMLQYLSSMKDTKDLTLKDLSLKLVILVALTTAQRGQSLHLMDTANMVHEQNSLVFMLGSAIKQTKPGRSSSELTIKLTAYPPDEKLCVVRTCLIYLEKTKSLRGTETQLFITHQKPHKKASRDTIRRWIKQIMATAGIDVTVFKPHSVRAAATSKAKLNNASTSDIMKAAGWTSAATFAKYYDKPIDLAEPLSFSVLK